MRFQPSPTSLVMNWTLDPSFFPMSYIPSLSISLIFVTIRSWLPIVCPPYPALPFRH